MSGATASWFVPRMWEDGECWIIGGGSSFPRQFGVPEEHIQKVMDNELPMNSYSPYFKEIHNKHVIGTNVAYLLGDWISVLYFGDLPFYRNNILELHNFNNLKVTDTGNLPTQDPSALATHKRIRKLKREMLLGISEKPDTIRWNHNSGAGAINLAALTGVKRIVLLGFDMQPNKNGQTHWHKGLPGYRVQTAHRDFVRFLRGFPRIATDAKRLNIEILNVSMDSLIPDFKKVELKEVL